MTRINFKLTDVHYTGGGIYCYFGKLSDGRYFDYSDFWEEAVILDADPLKENEWYDYDGYDPDWIEEHDVGCLDAKFCVRILQRAEKDGHISYTEMSNRVDELKPYVRDIEKKGKNNE